ncbi:MAG: endonuclease III [Candidatus Cloacimonetes bacterium]|nr:endonuclease III [Candidatus Cloacimonadota bacterium]
MKKKKFDINLAFRRLEPVVRNLDAPVVEFVAIQNNDPFRILIATILSARTTDQITTRVIEKLFKRVTDFVSLQKLSLKEIEELIYPAGFYRQKAKQLQKLPVIIKEQFNGQIPSEIDDLIKLPGVGRKTANLVRAVAFGKPAICVDTHVHRITNRWGYVKTKTPLETEMTLRKKLPKKYWLKTNSYLVAFGQKICRPIGTKCNDCPLYDICPSFRMK